MSQSLSVIIPTHERSDLVARAIESVLNQTHSDFECIVVDDGSTDETEEVVKSYDDDRVEYLCHDTNRGASAARNTGINHASGTYLAFLDDDDQWAPTKLEKQVDVLESTPKTVALVYCWMDYYDSNGEIVREHHPTLDGYVFPQVLDRQRIGACSTIVVRRTIAESVDGFDESLPRGNDGDFIRKVTQNHLVAYVPEVLVKFDWGHGYSRISDYDQEGIRNAIRGQEAKLRKFDAELRNYPERAARIYAQIGQHYGQLGEWRQSIQNFEKALKTAPSSPTIYRMLLRTIRDGLRR